MKKYLLLILLTGSINVYSQEYFIKGNNCLIDNQYRIADSLYSISISKFETRDAFYNRAVARFYLSDTCDACIDLERLSREYYDKESIILFNNYCCDKVDTLFYDKKYNISDISNYKYYEITKQIKCGNKHVSTIHNRKLMNARVIWNKFHDAPIGLFEIRTDIIASYILNNGQKVFNYIYKNHPITSNEQELSELKKRTVILLENKYNLLKEKNKIKEITVLVHFIINEDGSIQKPDKIETIPQINYYGKELDFKNDIIKVMNHYPNFNPIKFKKEKVQYYYISKFVF